MRTATYHGITKATCLSCGKKTTDIAELEILNDLDNLCECNARFTKWETTKGTFITIEMEDYQGNTHNFREEVGA
jgi:hypothetical protein